MNNIKKAIGETAEKKRIRRTVALILAITAVIVVVMLLSYNFGSEPEETEELPETAYRSGMLYFNNLDYHQQLVYDMIKEAAEQTASYTEQFVAELDKESFVKIVRALGADNPELFYVDYESLELRESEDGRMLVRMKYRASRNRIAEMMAELDAKASEITERADKYTGSYERELFLHDYITETASLVSEFAETADTEASDEGGELRTVSAFVDTVYGVLVECAGNVKGYALAMKYLMNRCGEPCFLVFGKLSGGEEHVWNLVYINDKFYHTDVAWDDADIRYSELKFHAYFNLSEAAVTLSRSLSDPELIPASENENDYYFASGLVAKNEAELKAIVYEQITEASREQREYIEILPVYTDDINKIRSALEAAFVETAEQLNKNGIGIVITSGSESINEISDINAKKINLSSAFRIYHASNERNALTIQLFYD